MLPPDHAPLRRAMAPGDWALLGALSLLWGGSFFFNAVAAETLPTFTIVAARVGLGALLLNLAIRASGQDAGWGRNGRQFLIMGVINTVLPFSLIAWGQHHVASGLAATLNTTTPLFAVLVAHLSTEDERLTRGSLAGVAIGFAGAAVLIGPDLAAFTASDLAAQVAILAAAACYAVAGVYGRRFGRTGTTPLVAAAGQISVAAAILIPLSLAFDRPWALPLPAPSVWAALAGLGALSTFVAYIIYYRILARAGAVNLMTVTFLIPVSATLLGVLFLAERVGARQLIGMAAIGVGLAAIDGRALRRILALRSGRARRPMY